MRGVKVLLKYILGILLKGRCSLFDAALFGISQQVLPMPSYTSLKKHTFDESTDVKTAMDVDALIQAAASSAGGVAMDTNQVRLCCCWCF